MKTKKKKEKPFYFTNLQGVKYRVLKREPPKIYNAVGLCFAPTDKNPRIMISQNLEDKMLLNVSIHEIAHSMVFSLSEKQIEKIANTISRYLWREGWRKLC